MPSFPVIVITQHTKHTEPWIQPSKHWSKLMNSVNGRIDIVTEQNANIRSIGVSQIHSGLDVFDFRERMEMKVTQDCDLCAL